MPLTRELTGATAQQQNRHVVGRVRVAVAHPGTVHQHHLVQERPVTIRRRPQLLDERREQADVIGVDLRQLRERLGHVAVMRQRMVRIRHVDLRVGAATQLVPGHEGGDPRAIGLVRQQLQVVHQSRMLGETGRHAHRPRHQRDLPISLRLDDFDAPLDVTDRVEIRADFRAVTWTETALQPRHVLTNGIENAALLAHTRLPRLRIRRLVVAEQPLEDRARIVFHRQRCRGVPPRDRVGECAAEAAAIARSSEVGAFQPELQRSQRRVSSQLPGRNLVHRDRLRVPGARMHVGQEPRRGAGVGTAPAPGGWRTVEPRQHQELVAKRRQRLQDRRQLEPGAVGGGRPVLHDHTVGNVDRAEPHNRRSRRGAERAQRRHHAVQQRQGDAGAQSPKHRSTGDDAFGDHASHGHDSDLLI